jgi:hypothetical protein
MRLIVWNSQGNKWESFWATYLRKEVESPAGEDVVGLLVESGWPPWVQSQSVRVSAIYPFDSAMTYYNRQAETNSDFVKYKLGKRQLKALWVPWARVKDQIDGRTNSRCSMGAIVLPAGAKYNVSRFQINDTSYRRPVLTLALGQVTVFLVHLVSGKPSEATTTLNKMCRDMQKRIPQGTAAIIVGDMNINQLNQEVKYTAIAGWNLLNVNQPTQKSGGELDFALYFNPKQKVGESGARPSAETLADAGSSGSDHAVMKYTL